MKLILFFIVFRIWRFALCTASIQHSLLWLPPSAQPPTTSNELDPTTTAESPPISVAVQPPPRKRVTRVTSYVHQKYKSRRSRLSSSWWGNRWRSRRQRWSRSHLGFTNFLDCNFLFVIPTNAIRTKEHGCYKLLFSPTPSKTMCIYALLYWWFHILGITGCSVQLMMERKFCLCGKWCLINHC